MMPNRRATPIAQSFKRTFMAESFPPRIINKEGTAAISEIAQPIKKAITVSCPAGSAYRFAGVV